MKRRMVLALCLLLTLTGVCPALAYDGADIAKAFAWWKTFELRAVGLPEAGEALGGMPVALSPDGKTYLWRTNKDLYVVRDGKTLPVTPAPERGAGDPYEKLEWNLKRVSMTLPGAEGVSWSPDGRYAALTLKKLATAKNDPLDLMLLDAETGEAFLAATCAKKNAQGKTGGCVFEAQFDRTGRYLYFTGRLEELSDTYALFRCDLSTFQTELVRENVYPVAATGLFEQADGRWLAVCAAREEGGKTPEAVSVLSPSAPEEDRQFVRRMPSSAWTTEFIRYSAQSGYGLMIGRVVTESRHSGYDGNEQALYARTVANALSFSRITPAGAETDRFFLFRDRAGALSNVQAEEVDPAILDITAQALTDGQVTQGDVSSLKDFANELNRYPAAMLTCGCLSPDGRYALLNLGRGRNWRFFLMDMKTMNLRPVEAPDGLAGNAIATALGARYAPGMIWNPDGTLLIYDQNSRGVTAWQLAVR